MNMLMMKKFLFKDSAVILMIKVNPILEKLKSFADDLDDCELAQFLFEDDPDYPDCLVVKICLREVEE